MKIQVLALLIRWLISPDFLPVTEDSVTNASYKVETIQMPEGLESETGALDFLPDGRLVACFLRGEVMIYEPVHKQWKLFAEGLHEPLGLMAISESEFLVMQRPELTRIRDTDGDGKADLYETVTDEFGMTGNYHEWNYGPVKDKAGNLFISLSTASEYGYIMKEVRGKLDTLTLVPGKPMQKYSAVPYRGWIMKLSPDGKLLPYASGFRSPNGLGFDHQGSLIVTDNQGDWVGTSKLYHVHKDKFYGHPASLIWEKNWNKGDPSKIPVEELDQMRTKASVLFPHGIIGNSLTQPLLDDTRGKFGPFEGQLFIGEMNKERIVRVMLEEVDGVMQGACIPFIDGHGLRKGNNRLAFAPDGSLWSGQAEYGFVGDKGIQRIVFTGKKPMDIYSMKLTSEGFELTFTQPVDEATASNPDNYKFNSYFYNYHLKYGSDQYDKKSVAISDIKISYDRRKVRLNLSSLQPGYVYELNLGEIKSESGEALANKIICYTLNVLKKQ